MTAFEGVTRGESDYSAVVTDVTAGNPQVVYFGGMDAEGMKLVVQLRQAGFEGVFFGPDGIKIAAVLRRCSRCRCRGGLHDLWRSWWCSRR